MELLVLITVMVMSFGMALAIMKGALEFLLHSMNASSQPVRVRMQRRPSHIGAEQLAA